jgi:hypothetical protein
MANPIKSLTPQERYELCYILESRNWHTVVKKLGLHDYPMQEPTVSVSPQKQGDTEGGEINWGFVFVVGFLAIAAFHIFSK